MDLDISPHPTCRRYTDFLLRCAYTEVYPVLIAMLFGVEASYLAAWSAFAPAGLYAEFITRWSNPDFAAYVDALGRLAGACVFNHHLIGRDGRRALPELH